MRTRFRALIVMLFGLHLFFAGMVSAQETGVNSLFYKANEMYEDGAFIEAAEKYEQILNSGNESGEIYFNLANAYFKADRLAEAILNYERARRLMPRDADLKKNYDFAISEIKSSGTMNAPFWKRVFSGISAKLTIDEMSVLISALFVLLLLNLFVYIKSGKKSGSALAILILFALFEAYFLTGAIIKYRETTREAIVMNEEVTANFAPLKRSTVHFTLYEGQKVYITEKRKHWYEIKRPDNKTGWVPEEVLAVI